jgi:hypothetical protein
MTVRGNCPDSLETNWIYFQILHVPESHVTMVVPVSYQGLLGFAGVHPGTGEHFVKVGIRDAVM